jgi:signal transduction histidine kinase/ligand-binding sensor domain-containing protein/DNA-binding response OmpR family regulator
MDKVQKTALLACAVLIHCGILLFAQDTDYRFRHLTTEDGLPSNYTWYITQDSNGFIWIYTRAGLCRYDGYNVKVYQYDPADSTTISDIYIKSTITVDTNGFIWVGSTNGVNKFNPITETFTRYYKDPDNSHTIRGNLNRITYLDRQGVVWIGTDNQGLNRYNAETDNFDTFLPSPDFSLSNGIRGIYDDSSGILWVGTGNGLYQFDRKTGEFILIKQLMKKGEKIANRFTTITEDNEGNIWYCADRIYKYDKSTKELTLFTGFSVEGTGSPNPMYMNILLDKHAENQTLWIARDGLYKYDLSAGKLTTIFNDPSDLKTYVGRNPRGFYMDPSGLIWIATTSGISILDPRSGQIKSHSDVAEKFQLDVVSFLKDSQGHFWIGGDNGLVHYDQNMRLIHWYKPTKENKNSFNGTVRDILEDGENNIWIVCFGDGVYLLDRGKNEFLRCQLLKYGKDIRPDNLYDIYEDAQGTLWVGSDGLFKKAKGTPEPTSFSLDISNWRTRYTTHTRITEDQSGNLWISSIAGAVMRQPQSDRGTDKFIEYTHDPADPTSLSNSHCWTVYADDLGEVWVGTNHGLNRYVPEKDCFERFLVDAEPGVSYIYDIKRDRNGCLWMVTEKGLISFDPSTTDKSTNAKNQIKQYLPFNQVYRSRMYKDHAGKIFVGSRLGSGNGYFSYHPDDITKNSNIPPIVITSFTVRNRALELDTAITLKQDITLSYNENYFSFEFAALDYTKPEQNQYAFMLEGLDEDWIYSGNRRFATYTKVPPGDYVFRVKGSNNDGYWNETGASVAITVLPPPWKTWWAYAGYATILIGLIVLWRIYDLRRIRLRQQLELEHVEAHKLKELDTMKSRFFANISHEFRTPLTLILGPLQKLLARHGDEESTREINIAQKNALRLQQLIDQLLTLSRIEAGKLKLQVKEENLVRLVNGYFQSFESLAKQKNIRLEFHADQEEILAYVDQDKMEKVLYNLLSNAFKFTPEGGRVAVTVGGQRSAFISITDTGPGISPAHLPHIFDRFYQADDSDARFQEGTGIGLALAKELVELHHGEIRVESELGKGTAFFVLLPLGSGQLREEEKRGRGEDWRIGGLEDWRIGGLEDWRIGGLEDWRIGGLEDWRIGGLEEGLEEFETWNLEHETRNSKHETRNTKHETRNTKHETHSPLLLIVEDNRDLRYYIRGFLEDSYSIIECGDGKAGFEKALETIPDLVISDVMMPVMDGYELCTKLKTDERTSHIPVILLTARAAVEDKLQGLETGADDYVAKPFNPEELLARIRNLIQQRKALREKFISDYWKGPHMPGLQIPASGLGMMDKEFLKKAIEVTESHLSDPDFSISVFCREIAMSRQQLYRKLRALMDQAPTEFVRTIRLKKAAELLAQRSGTVSEIAYDTGFNTLSYFTKCFKEQFGVNPSEYPPGNSK